MSSVNCVESRGEQRTAVVDDDDEHKGLDDRDAQEAELGSRKTVRKHDFFHPSEQQKIQHEMTHLPFRSLCGYCIKGSEKRPKKNVVSRGTAGLHVHWRREGRTLLYVRRGRRLCSALWCRKIDGIVDLPKTGVREHHCEVG